MRVSILPLSLFCLVSAILPAVAAERCALVLGVSDYEVFQPLDNPRQDHAEMVKALGKMGFAVTELHNPTRAKLEEITKQFSQKNQDAREVVFYYSGHGLQVQGRNYLTGTDSQLEVNKGLEELTRTSLSGEALLLAKEAHIRQAAEAGLVPLDTVLGHMESMGQRGAARVIILDCCRNNPLGTKTLVAKSVLPPKGGLGRVDAPKGMLIAFAAREGKVALQTEFGRPSLYTAALLKHIQTPGLEVEQVFKRTRATVLDLSQEEQEPAEYTNLTGSLVFNRSGSAPESQTASDTASELARMKAELDELRKRPGGTVAGVESQPPSPNVPELPERGYFDLGGLFAGSPYAGYNSYSQGRTLRRAQEVLQQEGYYTGTPDGLPGRGTQQALIEWQRKNLGTVTGRFSPETLAAMKLANLPPESAPEVRRAPVKTQPSASQASRVKVQPAPAPTPSRAPAPAKPAEMSPEEFLRRARALEN